MGGLKYQSASKNKLTVDNISIENMNTQEKTLGVNATIEDIKKELFEGDVVDEKNTDYGLGEILKNKEKNKEI